jgi:hypothetical protein
MEELRKLFDQMLDEQITDADLVAFLEFIKKIEGKAGVRLVSTTTDVDILCKMACPIGSKPIGVYEIAKKRLKELAPEKHEFFEQMKNVLKNPLASHQ